MTALSTRLLPAIVAIVIVDSVSAAARPVVSTADVRIAFQSATECQADVSYVVDGAVEAAIDHRLLLNDGTRVDDVRISRARVVAGASPTGRTLSLALEPAPGVAYQISYRVTQPEEWRFRCPVWLPALPTASGPNDVRIRAGLPAGAQPVGTSFPLLRWTRDAGEAALGDVPTLVQAPFAAAGQPVEWDERIGIGRLVDAIALTMIVVGTMGWALLRRRR